MNLFVGNLNPDTTDRELRILFSEFGEIVTCKVIKDPATGDSRGFGFVEMGTKNAAQDAIDNLDCTYLNGNIISVKEAKQATTKGAGNRNDRQPGSRPGGNRYGSGNPGTSHRTYKPRTNNTNYNRNYNTDGADNNKKSNDNFNSFDSFNPVQY